MLKTLRRRFVAVTMSIVTAMLLVIFGMVYFFTAQNLEEQSITALRTSVLDRRLPRPNEEQESSSMPVFAIRQSGDRWFGDPGSAYDLTDSAYVEELAAAVMARSEETGTLEDYQLRYYRETTPMGAQISFVSVSMERFILRRLVETCCFIGVLSFTVFLFISFRLARWAVKPVDQAWQQQKQFIADASHELKTPLTVIQTSAELLRQTDAVSEQLRFTENILEMSGRMRLLVEELLTLARSDNEKTAPKSEAVSWSDIVTGAILPFEPVFFEAGLLLTSEIEPEVTVRGNDGQLRQLTELLLDNARKYALPGSEATVSLKAAGRSAVLRVSNPSAPLTQEQCRDIFKRFYRTDASRTGGESFGLGLSIADAVVRQHRGQIRAAYEGGVFSVFVSLPCVRPGAQHGEFR